MTDEVDKRIETIANRTTYERWEHNKDDRKWLIRELKAARSGAANLSRTVELIERQTKEACKKAVVEEEMDAFKNERDPDYEQAIDNCKVGA